MLGGWATSIGVDLRDAKVEAEGDLDFRGTLGVSKEAPVGLRSLRLLFDLETDASEGEVATLVRLTERYCVVLQTLRSAPEVSTQVVWSSFGSPADEG
ncbi:MAG TPA: OsmC family protein [Actinomycetota bacterium]|nr:OsmC family protein [Actinomycetota bacterium]